MQDSVQENAAAQSEPLESATTAPTEQVKFETLDLDASVQRGIDALGFEFCSPIQGRILPHTLAGNDAIGKAQTAPAKLPPS